MENKSFKKYVIGFLKKRRLLYAVRRQFYYGSFIKDFFTFKKLSLNSGRYKIFPLYWKNRLPILGENTKTTHFDVHYIYHPAWAARTIAKIQPQKHIDIGSTLSFSTMISAFIPVSFYDYRPAYLNLSNLESGRADLLSLPFETNSIASLSCLHTVEHVGLGRYGDPLDPDGDLKAIAELQRVTKVGGSLLFVVPIGKSKLQFNGQRIYSYEQITLYFKNFTIREFTLIPDDAITKGIMYNSTKEQSDAQMYAAGCFWFIKKF